MPIQNTWTVILSGKETSVQSMWKIYTLFTVIVLQLQFLLRLHSQRFLVVMLVSVRVSRNYMDIYMRPIFEPPNNESCVLIFEDTWCQHSQINEICAQIYFDQEYLRPNSITMALCYLCFLDVTNDDLASNIHKSTNPDFDPSVM